MAQAGPQWRDAKPAFLRDLNVFSAAFIALVSFASFAIFIPLSIVLKLVLPSRQAELLAWPLGYGLVAVFLCWRWWKHGLSPRQVDPSRQTRFRLGRGLIAFFNVAMAAMYARASFGAYSLLPAMPAMPAIAGVVIALTSAAPMGLLAGLYMVLSARGTGPAFADTSPAAADSVRQTPSAKWPPERTPAGLPPSVMLVMAGLVATSLVLYMAGVFGFLAFTREPKLYTNTVLPIVGGVYAVYVITALVLLVKRVHAANWVAWAPVTLFVVVLPLIQWIVLLFRSLIRMM